MITRLAHVVLCTLMFALLSGCGGGNPIARWQTEVAYFIDKENNGDVNALRNYGEPIDQREFGIIGGSEGGVGLISPTRSDTTGVMLGRAQVGEVDWHVFLVGVITYTGSFAWMPLDNPAVEDIRLAAFHLDAHGRYIWRMTEPDPSQLAVYLTPQHEQWGQRYKDYPQADTHPNTVFPWEGDQFEFAVNASAQTLTATERTSGAKWTLNLIDEDDRAKLAAGK